VRRVAELESSLTKSERIMSTRKVLAVFGVIAIVVGLPFVLIHLMAAPDDAPITPLQHVVAALANYLGPWGVTIAVVLDWPTYSL
jgi:hypothetical protein